jgi:hypothetical protein
MTDLILRPSGMTDPTRTWALQLRYHDSVGETAYRTLCRVSDEVAQEIERAGAPFYLFGAPKSAAANVQERSTP